MLFYLCHLYTKICMSTLQKNIPQLMNTEPKLNVVDIPESNPNPLDSHMSEHEDQIALDKTEKTSLSTLGCHMFGKIRKKDVEIAGLKQENEQLKGQNKKLIDENKSLVFQNRQLHKLVQKWFKEAERLEESGQSQVPTQKTGGSLDSLATTTAQMD
jgi:regulator of replication initiation timing